jgi:hydrogenase nickel incorporation protein HypA/HybF
MRAREVGIAMHELPITEALLNLALKHAEEAGATRITQLNLVIGQLSAVVDDSVQFYWDIVSRGTIAEGARLEFRRVAAMLRCGNCGAEFRPDGRDYLCPRCSSTRVEMVSGDDFQLESIEIED